MHLTVCMHKHAHVEWITVQTYSNEITVGQLDGTSEEF